MKRTLFTHFLLLIAISTLCFSCNNEEYEPYYQSDPSGYSNTNKVYFSNIILFMKPYTLFDGEKKYIATEQLFNLELSINKLWTNTFDSYRFDISKINQQEKTEHFFLSDKPIPYAFEIDVSMVPEELLTAGDYAHLLNHYWNLQPGAYICQIKSFDLITLSGKRLTVHTPTLFTPLEIKEGVSSINLGEFEVEI